MISDVTCAVRPCDERGDVWAYSPRLRGLVPTCDGHALDVVAGGVRLSAGVPVLERGVRA
jgi:hypothetical protein